MLDATKRRFEARWQKLREEGDLRQLAASIFAWYQFSQEANTEGCDRPGAPGAEKKFTFSQSNFSP